MTLRETIEAINAARRAGAADPETAQHGAAIAAANERLFAYGTLLPHQRNHRVVERLSGTWRPAVMPGRILRKRLEAPHGYTYPGLVLDNSHPPVVGQILESPDLPGGWPVLDGFEGPEYDRLLAFAQIAGADPVLVNTYVLKDPETFAA